MKIIASIPVEKTSGNGCFSFRHEQHEVEVVRVIRHPATRNPDLNRWHYQADIKDHPALCKEAIRIGPNFEYRVNIHRRSDNPRYGLNPKWKPPEFPNGGNWVDIPPEEE